MMNSRKTVFLNIALSLLFAALIIVGAKLFPEYDPALTYWLIAIWWIPFSILNYKATKGANG
ncbi:hypothetical protein V6R21_03200 [Limibacter armeniacum]|uniref:hypothetical protein n=1 Tax=Limibacter armeniacum TaxID=466084 RepID=UPI002FE60AFC